MTDLKHLTPEEQEMLKRHENRKSMTLVMEADEDVPKLLKTINDLREEISKIGYEAG